MVNHGPTLHFDKDRVNMKINHVYFDKYSFSINHLGLLFSCPYNMNHGQPWSIIDNNGQSWSTMDKCHIVTKIVTI